MVQVRFEQASLFLDGSPSLEEWTNDDWQTPSKEAQKIASLIEPHELDILEPAAGAGQLIKPIKQLPNRTVTAIELKAYRVRQGKEQVLWADWQQANFLTDEIEGYFDLIIANPPFSLRMEFIERSLQLLKRSGRLLFLMPIDFNCGLAMGNRWKELNCHIHHQYTFQNRVAYLDKDGKPQSGRQIYDAVFDIRQGKIGATRTFL